VSAPSVRPASAEDAKAVAAIFAQGIADRVATFETVAPGADEVGRSIGGDKPFLVAERDGEVAGWAKVSPYDPGHDYYASVGEATVYVARDQRGSGVGAALLDALSEAAAEAGFHKLVAKLLTTNSASIRLFESHGWRPVGVHHRHGCLDGEWKDVLVVERLLGAAAE
jgi:phosphinothricin acetyltransferase